MYVDTSNQKVIYWGTMFGLCVSRTELAMINDVVRFSRVVDCGR